MDSAVVATTAVLGAWRESSLTMAGSRFFKDLISWQRWTATP